MNAMEKGYFIGKLCRNNHRHQEMRQSIRAEQWGCVACINIHLRSKKYYLGKPCKKHSHVYAKTKRGLRYTNSGGCIACHMLLQKTQLSMDYGKEYYHANKNSSRYVGYRKKHKKTARYRQTRQEYQKTEGYLSYMQAYSDKKKNEKIND